MFLAPIWPYAIGCDFEMLERATSHPLFAWKYINLCTKYLKYGFSTGKTTSRNTVVLLCKSYLLQDITSMTKIKKSRYREKSSIKFETALQVLDGTPWNAAPKPSKKNHPEWSQSEHLLLWRVPSLQKVSSAPPTPLRRSAWSILQRSSKKRSQCQEKRVSHDPRLVVGGFHVRSKQIHRLVEY